MSTSNGGDWARRLRELRAARKRAADRERARPVTNGAWHYRERRVSGWGVAVLFVGLAAAIVGMLLYVFLNWPEGQY